MPLTQAEAANLRNVIGSLTAGEVAGDTNGGGIDALCQSVSRLLNMVTPLVERALNEPETIDGAPATDAPRRRGRKPAGGGDGVAATAPQPGATAPTAPPPQAAQGVAQAAPAKPTPAPTDNLGFDPLEETPAQTQGDGLALPGFLDRSAQQPQQAAPAPAPAPKSYNAQEVKDVLKRYMEKKGATGTADLTALLVSVGGVKKFSELPPDKYGEMVRRAMVEAGLS